MVVLWCGCGAEPPQTRPHLQAYRAHVATAAGDEIPFLLEVPPNCNTGPATIVNGSERITAGCQRLGSRLLIDFPVFGTRISAEVGKGEHLAGDWSHTGGGFRDRLAFSAVAVPALDASQRFSGPPGGDPADATAAGPGVSGIWRMEFSRSGLAKGVFEVPSTGVVHGTAQVPSEYGDLRFLAGNLRGAELSLSTFDGGSAYLLRGRLGTDGRMRGEFVGADGTRDTFVAVRSADFDLGDPLQQVHVTSRERKLDFAPLRAPRYAGKAVIVELFGTWCSNCNDLAPLLSALHREHRNEGLEVLALAYEASDDDGYTQERVNAYRARHGADWEVVIAREAPNDLLAPARMSPMEGVPITIFLNRDRTIHAIYTGFWGPATGAAHQEAVETFRRLTRDILDSPAVN
jgi:thiol-disulfide isomerase/thioredoxin